MPAEDSSNATAAVFLPVRRDRSSSPPGTSFAAPTSGNALAVFVNGKNPFRAIRDELLTATEFVYIADWMLDPDVALVRDGSPGPATLYDTLAQVAAKGVSVYVSLYDSVELALDTRDEEAEARLRSIAGVHFQKQRPNTTYSHHQKFVVVDGKVAFLGGIDLCDGRWDTEGHELHGDLSTFPARDYCNPGVTEAEQLGADPNYRKYQVDWTRWMQVGRVATPPKSKPYPPPVDSSAWRAVYPRMPWEDVHCRLSGPSALDVARNFEERWNFIERDEYQGRDLLSPAPSASVGTFDPVPFPGLVDGQIFSTRSAQVQVVRSVGMDSFGVATEASILDAYIRVIDQATRHVYIENQFFVSKCVDGTDANVENTLASHLLAKVKTAIANQTEFRIDLVLPVHAEGDMRSTGITAAPPRTRFHQNRSLCRDEFSLAGQIKLAIVQDRLQRGLPVLGSDHLELECARYLRIYCLRQTGVVPGNSVAPGAKFVTEQVYVHTKLLVVDDRWFILGSANINDRSLLGHRDSEIAIVVQDDTLVDGWLADGRAVKGALPLAIRRGLWANHWELDVEDPLQDAKTMQLYEQARQNTEIFDQVFPGIPSDRYTRFDDWIAAQRGNWTGSGPSANDMVAGHLLGQVKGQISLYPTRFLFDQGMDSGGALAELFV